MTMAQILQQQGAVNVLRPGRRSPPPTKSTTPKDQLEIAAQWLSEAALALKGGDAYVRLNAERVAQECLSMARRA